MKLKQVIQILEDWAPSAYQESYDNSGLICGDSGMEVNGALVSLDCTEDVVEEALNNGCNLIIAHHPIVFSGLKSLTGKSYVERTVIKAIKSDVSIYALHTNLDNISTGVNKKIGDTLGLKSLSILSPKFETLHKLSVFVPHDNLEHVKKAAFDAGAGHIGDYDHCSFASNGTGSFRGGKDSNPYVGEKNQDHFEAETKLEVIVPDHYTSQVLSAVIKAHPYEEVAYDYYRLENQNPRVGSGMIGSLDTEMTEKDFLNLVSEKFKTKVIRHTNLLNKPVKRIAFCGGSGQFLLEDAKRNNADVFISGDFKYHEFFDAEQKLVIMDIGHFESEQFTPNLISEYLEDKNVTFAVLLSRVKTNPVNYFINQYGSKEKN